MISYLFGQRHKLCFHTGSLFTKFIYKKKDTLGLLNHGRIKKMIYIKQRNHHSIFLTPTKKKDGNWIIYGSAYNTTYIFFFRRKKRSKMQIPLWSRMQYTKKACTVIQFSLFFGSLASFCEIEEPFLLYHQGNDPSTR